MKFNKTKIEGLYVIDLEPRVDERGYFTRVYCNNELKDIGVKFNIVQINRSFSKQKGLIRGMHYQKKPYEEDKIVQCLQGEIFDVAIDLRSGSKTFGKWYAQKLSAENKKLMLIPKGFAHGFQALTQNCVVEYFVSEFYTPGSENGIRWDDPKFGIDWPIKKAILSEKDQNWPLSNL